MTFESIIRCYQCDPCRRGDFNQCARGILLGMERDGLFGTVVDVPALLAHDVSDLAALDGGLRAAVCIEPAACGYVACVAVPRGSRATACSSSGPVRSGCSARCCVGSRSARCAVHVVEPVPFRRELAARWADRTWDVEEFFADPPAVRFDVLIEASGAVENVDRAFRRLGPNGRVALLARSGRPLASERRRSPDHEQHLDRGLARPPVRSLLRRALALPRRDDSRSTRR